MALASQARRYPVKRTTDIINGLDLKVTRTRHSRKTHGELTLRIVDALARSKFGLLNYITEPALYRVFFLTGPPLNLLSVGR